MASELSRARRECGWLSVIVAEVDHFEKFTGEFGRGAGDRLLVQVATTLGATVMRSTDFIGRYGEDKFAIILPGANPKQASLVAERVRKAIASANFVLKNASMHKITMTLGGGQSKDSSRRGDPGNYRPRGTTTR